MPAGVLRDSLAKRAGSDRLHSVMAADPETVRYRFQVDDQELSFTVSLAFTGQTLQPPD